MVPRGVVESDGTDACYLATRYGLRPDPWQEDVLVDWLGRRAGGRWAASSCGLAVPRQNGKNAIIEVVELYAAAILGERILHTAHEVKTARKAFLRIASFFENEREYPELAALVQDIRKTNGQEAVLLRNGGGIEFIARSRGSGRGFTVDRLVCDEAQDLSDEELAALLPTISAAPLGNPQVVITGTPPDINRPQQGEVFRRMRADAAENRDARLAFIDYGVVDGPLPDVDDRALWSAANPAEGERLSILEIERERALMSPERFAQERLGWWGDPSSVSRVFPAGAWEASRTNEPPGEPAAIGVAVSLDRAWTSLGACAADGYMGAVKRERGTAWVISEVVRIHRERGVRVVIAGTGPGGSLIDVLEREGVPVLVAGTEDYCRACADLYDAVTTGTAVHGGHVELDAAVAHATQKTIGDRWAWGRRGGDVSMLEAVTLARWAAVADPAYDPLDSIY